MNAGGVHNTFKSNGEVVSTMWKQLREYVLRNILAYKI